MKLISSLSGKIATGQYENESPFFSIEKEFPNNLTEDQIREELLILNGICRSSFDNVARISNIRRTQKEVKNIRFYIRNGKEYPSVTSILGYKQELSEFNKLTPEELSVYASKGNIIHKQAEIYILTGEWKEPNEIPEIFDDYLKCKKAGMVLNDVNFLAFEQAFPMTYISAEQELFNEEHLYAGRNDIKCIYDGKVTLADIKTGGVNSEKTLKCLKQLSAYAKCEGNEDVEQIMMIPLNPKTKQGYSKAVIADPNDYFPLFLKQREQFKLELGI